MDAHLLTASKGRKKEKTGPETEAGATDSLRDVEGLEGSFYDGGSHAGACVGDGEDEAGPACGPVLSRSTVQDEATAAERLHGVDGIADEDAEYLADLSLKTLHWSRGPIALFDPNGGVQQAALKDGEDAVDELFGGDFLRAGGKLGMLSDEDCESLFVAIASMTSC